MEEGKTRSQAIVSSRVLTELNFPFVNEREQRAAILIMEI